MQARCWPLGDCPSIALAPQSPQEAFDQTIRAFNIAERLRTPVLLMSDEVVGHMHERVIIPPPGQIPLARRARPTVPPGQYLPYHPGPDLVPPMALAGDGYAVRFTGLTHDETGRAVTNAAAQAALVPRLREKILKNRAVYEQTELYRTEDAKVLVVSYGITARAARRAVDIAREQGVAVGLFRPVTVWPFPEEHLRSFGPVRHVVGAEINLGQVSLEVERIMGKHAPVTHIGNSGGKVPEPDAIAETCVTAGGNRP